MQLWESHITHIVISWKSHLLEPPKKSSLGDHTSWCSWTLPITYLRDQPHLQVSQMTYWATVQLPLSIRPSGWMLFLSLIAIKSKKNRKSYVYAYSHDIIDMHAHELQLGKFQKSKDGALNQWRQRGSIQPGEVLRKFLFVTNCNFWDSFVLKRGNRVACHGIHQWRNESMNGAIMQRPNYSETAKGSKRESSCRGQINKRILQMCHW